MDKKTDVTTDSGFLMGMIEHHEAAIEMSQDYLKGSEADDRQARVVSLAKNIITAQTGEISKMKTWLSDLPKMEKAKEMIWLGDFN